MPYEKSIRKCEENESNLIPDRAVKFPAIRQFALGGYGLWWPGGRREDLQQQQAYEGAKEFLEVEQWEQEVAMWAPLCGNWHSSGRAELSAPIMLAHFELGHMEQQVRSESGRLVTSKFNF